MQFDSIKARALLEKHNLRQQDWGWMCGVGVRQARAWCLGAYPIPQYAALLLMAYDEGLIDAPWLARKIRTGVRAPARKKDTKE